MSKIPSQFRTSNKIRILGIGFINKNSNLALDDLHQTEGFIWKDSLARYIYFYYTEMLDQIKALLCVE